MAFREDTNTHKFKGETENGGLWGKFISHDLSASLSQAWSKGNAPKILSTEKPPIVKCPPLAKKRDYSHLLPIRERHKQIEQLLAQLSLTPAHRRSLLKRGFSDDQIKKHGFKSVSYQQPLKNPVRDRLADVLFLSVLLIILSWSVFASVSVLSDNQIIVPIGNKPMHNQARMIRTISVTTE